MAREYVFEGGPLSGCKLDGELKRLPDKVLVEYWGVRVPENLELEPGYLLTVGSAGLVAEYKFDQYETGHFHFVQWSRLSAGEWPADDQSAPG